MELIIGLSTIILIISLIVAVVQNSQSLSSARSLQQKFVELGNLKGKTRKEIEEVVGNPNSISAAAEGRVLCQWISTGYHIALLFKDDICEGITHEFAA